MDDIIYVFCKTWENPPKDLDLKKQEQEWKAEFLALMEKKKGIPIKLPRGAWDDRGYFHFDSSNNYLSCNGRFIYKDKNFKEKRWYSS